MNSGHAWLRRSAVALAAAGLLGGLIVSPVSVSAKDGIVKQTAEGKIKPAVINTGSVKRQVRGFSGGTLTATRLNTPSSPEARAQEAEPANSSLSEQFAVSQGTLGCGRRNPSGNVRVNQDCTFRQQAEEIIKINPTNPQNIIVGQNDNRIGLNHCGFAFSFDSGQHWGDGTPPFFQRENHPENDGPNQFNPNRNTILGGPGTAHTYDAASDPSVAFDSQGRAFYSCVALDANTNASGVLVTQSPLGAGGSFYDTVPSGRVDPATNAGTETTKRFVVVEDNGNADQTTIIIHDKEFIAADAFRGSPNKDNVYVTWTVFFFDAKCVSAANPGGFCATPIYGSMSTDHAVSWSTPEEISGKSPLCALGNFFDPTRDPIACDLDHDSDVQPMPDGSLVIPFLNENPAGDTPNFQELAVVCHPSGSSPQGTAHLNCGSPTKVGDDVITGEPQCDFGLGRGFEQCVPGPFVRTEDAPRIGLDVESKSLYVVWQDYRNGEYDIQIRRSNNGGNSWDDGGTLNQSRGFDYFQPAIDVGSSHKVAVSFYRSDRVPNENTMVDFPRTDPGVHKGQSSYWLSGRQQPTTTIRVPFAAVRLSPFFPPPDGGQMGFIGDYSGLAVHGSTAHPVWSDTRNTTVVTSPSQGSAHDEDIFTDARLIPGGAGGGGGDNSDTNETQSGP